MKKDRNGKSPLRSIILLITVITASGLAWVSLRGQSNNASRPVLTATVFSPAHPTVGSSLREFFNIRPTPVQPIAYTHTVHVLKEQGPRLDCNFCHVGVDKGPVASIPGVN